MKTVAQVKPTGHGRGSRPHLHGHPPRPASRPPRAICRSQGEPDVTVSPRRRSCSRARGRWRGRPAPPGPQRARRERRRCRGIRRWSRCSGCWAGGTARRLRRRSMSSGLPGACGSSGAGRGGDGSPHGQVAAWTARNPRGDEVVSRSGVEFPDYPSGGLIGNRIVNRG